MNKTCRRCDTAKPVASFGSRKASSDGLHPWCQSCKRGYESEHRRSKPEMERAKRKRYRDSVKRREAEAWAYVGK